MTSPYLGQMGAMVALTFGVCGKAAVERVREVRQRAIPLRTLARAVDTAQSLMHTQSMDNFNNLLQVPILFYVLCLELRLLDMNTSMYGALLWCYVLLRIGHTLIQITYNNVLHRFTCWMASNLLLCLAWMLLGGQEFANAVGSR